MRGIPLAAKGVAGGFRGEGPVGSRLSTYNNGVLHPGIGFLSGYEYSRVVAAVRDTFVQLDGRLDAVDRRWHEGAAVAEIYEEVLEAAAWVHGQWVRIHPFADHNGSTARLMAVAIGMRYDIPLNLPGKPRSELATEGLQLDYEVAARNQMAGDDSLMKKLLHRAVVESGA